MALSCDVEALVGYALAHKLIAPEDAVWAHNALLEVVGAHGCEDDSRRVQGATDKPAEVASLEKLLAPLVDAACNSGAIEDAAGPRDRMAMRLMGVLTPRPSTVGARFEELMAQSPEAATTWFHTLCEDVGYIRTEAVARNIRWTSKTHWGMLELSVNLSKPEKDPRNIARAAQAPVSKTQTPYPACQLCRENEGYAGRDVSTYSSAHPARQNLRIVPITLGGDPWGLQYSPYCYYEEHCIAMNDAHVPMHVDGGNLGRLLDFVDLFPHYFIGSNADLPLVGGSILSHDHFQGGRHAFCMDHATTVQNFRLSAFPNVRCGVVAWPTSVLRLECADRHELLRAAIKVLDAWRGYDDKPAGIVSHTGSTRHNTVTPIAHRERGVYRLDLALRCNVTSEEHPLGVFHPHEELWHVKKENIGLIEVMGLAILPGRLDRELSAVAEGLLQGADLSADPLTSKHATWAREVAARHPEFDESSARSILQTEVSQVYAKVLEDTGVFKWDEPGRAALERFLTALGAE